MGAKFSLNWLCCSVPMGSPIEFRFPFAPSFSFTIPPTLCNLLFYTGIGTLTYLSFKYITLISQTLYAFVMSKFNAQKYLESSVLAETRQKMNIY